MHGEGSGEGEGIEDFFRGLPSKLRFPPNTLVDPVVESRPVSCRVSRHFIVDLRPRNRAVVATRRAGTTGRGSYSRPVRRRGSTLFAWRALRYQVFVTVGGRFLFLWFCAAGFLSPLFIFVRPPPL